MFSINFAARIRFFLTNFPPKLSLSFLLISFLILLDSAFALLLLSAFAIYLQILLPSSSQSSSGFSFVLSLVDPYVKLLPYPILLSFSIFVLVILVLSSAIRISTDRYIFKFSNYISTIVTTSFFKRYISASYLEFSTRPTSSIIATCHTSSLLLADTVVAVFQSFSALSFAFPFLLFLFFILPFPLFTFFALLAIPFVLISVFIKKRLRETGFKERTQASLVTKHLQESCGAFEEIKIYNLVDLFATKYYNYDLQYRQAHASNIFYSSLPKYMIEFFVLLFLPAVGLFSYFTDQSFSQLAAILGTTLLGLQKLSPHFTVLLRTWSVFIANRASIGDLFAYYQTNPEHLPVAHPFLPGSFPIKSLKLTKATFAYPGRTPIIDDINISLDSGTIYSIIGPTGAGKSTLTKILMGLLPLSDGFIEIKTSSTNYIVDRSNCNLLSTHVAYVPQDVFIFADSFLYNITLENDSSKLASAMEAAKIACIDKYIESLPFGYQTIVTERGFSLSGGQKQRLAIARALYMNKPILILDESTSALDSITEDKFLANIAALPSQIIVIFITHKPDQLKFPHCQISLRSSKIHLNYISLPDESLSF